MKRILHIVSCIAKGGTEAFIINHFRNIDRQKYMFDFLVFTDVVDPTYEKEIQDLGGHIYYGMPPELLHINVFVKRIIEIIKDNGPYEAVHAHINIANAWALYAAHKAGVKKRISHSHDTSGKEANNIVRRFYVNMQLYLINKYSTLKLACGELAGEYLYGHKSKSNQWFVMHNGIDVHKFIDVSQDRIESLRKEFNIENCSYVFGNITRFEEKKNISFVVDIYKEIIKKQPQSVLLLGGVDGGQLNMIKQKVIDNGLSDNVHFIGVRNDIEVCLKLIDIYIFPSKFEGLPIAMLEAQASGVYCAASNKTTGEIDIGLNLIELLSLKKSAEEWANTILNKLKYTKPNKEAVINKFRERGYDIRDSVKRLEKVYSGDFNET